MRVDKINWDPYEVLENWFEKHFNSNALVSHRSDKIFCAISLYVLVCVLFSIIFLFIKPIISGLLWLSFLIPAGLSILFYIVIWPLVYTIYNLLRVLIEKDKE